MKPAMFPPPPQKRRVMMHFADGGCDAVMFRCRKCGNETPYLFGVRDQTIRRGLPCPKCNREGDH